MDIINQTGYIIVLGLLLLTLYIKTVAVNFRIMRKKDFEKVKWIKTDLYLLFGPWTTKSLLEKPDKILGLEEEINEFYQSELKKGVKFRNGTKKIEEILKNLEQRQLNNQERIILRSYIDSDDLEDSNFMQVMSLFVSLVVAVFIGVTAAKLSNADNWQFYLTFFSAISLVVIYVFFLFFLSRQRSKAKVIRIALDRYEKKLRGN
ncbi:hypothetical protein MHI12_19910 [Paenibacillus sp. FSL H8-0280]|uniref:hypothetical protein n=1 Tax=Paenibacillus sp. FSL H8-0280 TaxID=2921382 RepID=UPI00325078F6